MSEQYTITAEHILQLLVSSRGYERIEQRTIRDRLKNALSYYEGGWRARYKLDDAVLASQDAGYILTAEEIEALAAMDMKASEVSNV